MDLDDQMYGKRESGRRVRVFTPYTVFLLVMFIVLLSLWIALKYYQHQEDEQEYLTISLDELGVSTQISRFKLEMQVLETQELIDDELELIENSKQSLMTAHLIDRTEWTATKDELLRILYGVSLEPTDQLYIDIEAAIADIDRILSS